MLWRDSANSKRQSFEDECVGNEGANIKRGAASAWGDFALEKRDAAN